MKLRFEVDQAECFRRGIDCPKSIVTVEVKPADIEPAIRELIAARMRGIDVCYLNGIRAKMREEQGSEIPRIIAKEPNFESLLDAVTRDQESLEQIIPPPNLNSEIEQLLG